jgi:hypothetical protein
MRKQLSAPVSLMVIVVGAALSYYVLHANGWSMSGDASLSNVYRSLPFQSRALVVVGLMLNAWGLGSLINALLAGRRNDQFPPSS